MTIGVATTQVETPLTDLVKVAPATSSGAMNPAILYVAGLAPTGRWRAIIRRQALQHYVKVWLHFLVLPRADSPGGIFAAARGEQPASQFTTTVRVVISEDG